jgi:hypothetical protein
LVQTSGQQNSKTNREYRKDVDYLAHKSQQQLHWHREGNLEPVSSMREASEEVQRQTGGIAWRLISDKG